ncbi:LicD family protein [Allofustis seminis]|uniref:LicD family protein n=1 Tax=Allofustis seminis TaxID=166939 RepID=UPI00037BC3A3|nr:LicD family protein [Allofustis seminis]
MDHENKYGIKDIQEKLLGILLYFSDFCQAHDLRFVLAGGTCLGAIRSGGIIPWDDDLDVFMLREDYEKLIPLWNKYADTDRYTILRSNDQLNIHHAATEVRDNYTTFINDHSKDLDMNQGLMIDIIPLDDVPASRFMQLYQKIHAMLFACYNFQRLPNHKSKLIYEMTKIALKLVPSFQARYAIWKYCEDQMIKAGRHSNGHVASIIEGPTIMKQTFPKDWIEQPAYVTFEGEQMPVPRDYDAWLTMSYGDYMQLPPEEERVLRHDIYFYDMHTPYPAYRGKYYAVKEGKHDQAN